MGIFITFEGIEGSGKTTQSRLLKEYLDGQGIPAIHTRNPGGTELGLKIRELVLHQGAYPVAELLLFLADRNQHVNEVIRPAINADKVVICDRYYHSTFAYQAGGRKIDPSAIEYINDLAIEGCRPDLTFLIDVTVEEGLSRARARDPELDRIEQAGLEFHRAVRESFLSMAREDARVTVVDGARDPQVIHSEVLEEFHRRTADLKAGRP